MSFSFNLIDEPWIPCLRHDGAFAQFSISDVLREAHNLSGLQGDTALETAAIHRLLLAILHRILGPKSRQEWKKWWSLRRFDQELLAAYLYSPTIHRAFDLFDPERPFYQPRKLQDALTADLAIPEKTQKGKQSLETLIVKVAKGAVPHEERTPIAKLLPQTASGNNATLFDHVTEAVGISLTPVQIARGLIAAQLFGIGETSGVSTNFVDAPGAKGILFLVRGDNLFETLMLNLVRYDEETPFPSPDGDDLPAWEMKDPFLPIRTQPKGYLDYLTWHNRRIWLFPEQTEQGIVVRRMIWAPGLVLEEDCLDPMERYIPDKQTGRRPLGFRAERAIWRDSSVLFSSFDPKLSLRAITWISGFAQAPHQVLSPTRICHLMALGMSKDQASIEFIRSEEFPLPTQLINAQEQLGELSSSLQAAEHSSTVLFRSVFLLALVMLFPRIDNTLIDADDKLDKKITKGRAPNSKDRDAQHAYSLARSWNIESLFWNTLEPHFHRFIQDIPDTPVEALRTWRNEVRSAAKASFAQAISYAGEDLRTQRAAALASQTFNRGLAAALGKANHSDSSSQEGTEDETT